MDHFAAPAAAAPPPNQPFGLAPAPNQPFGLATCLCGPFNNLATPLLNLVLAMDLALPPLPLQVDDPEDMIRADELTVLLEDCYAPDAITAINAPGLRPFKTALVTLLTALSKHSIPSLNAPSSNAPSQNAPSSTPQRNLCLICDTDLGSDNPRQLCGKTVCHNGVLAPRKRARFGAAAAAGDIDESEAEADEGEATIENGAAGAGAEDKIQGAAGAFDCNPTPNPRPYLTARRLFVSD